MPRFALCLVLMVAAGSASAQGWNLREMDIPLDMTQLWDLTAESTLTFADDGESRFSIGGSYSFTPPDDGPTEFGRFSLEGDGRVCIDFRNGGSRCDLFVRNGKALIMISERGDRFPVRVKLGLEP